MSPTGPLPGALRDLRPDPPDADFEGLRQESMARLGELAPDWTDHNVHDPGVTLLEVMLWALSDLHYRTENQDFRRWPAWRAEWRGLELAEGSRDRDGTAELLRDRKEEIRAVVDGASNREGAVQAVVTAFKDEGIREDDSAEALVRAIREPRMHEAILQFSGPVKEILALEGDGPEGRATIRALLAELELWPEEIDDLLLRTRIRKVAALLAREEAGVRDVLQEASSLPAALSELRARYPLEPGGELSEEEFRTLLHVDPAAPTNPETFEGHTGRSRVWPPHPLQLRTVEPCTGTDYERLLQAVPEVRRGWVLKGVARGIGWDGRAHKEELPWRKGALTFLVAPTDEAGGVELLPREPWTTLTARQRRYLRGVLESALRGEGGRSELARPHQSWTERLGPQTPRRMLGDEVGAALLSTWGVTVRCVLVVKSSARESAVLAEARQRLTRFLSPERTLPEIDSDPESTAAGDEPAGEAAEDPLDGPRPWCSEAWCVPARGTADSGGWSPGTPVGVPEVVALLSTLEGVVGVEGLAIRSSHAPQDSPWREDRIEIGPYAVPIYQHRPECLKTRIHREGSCDV